MGRADASNIRFSEGAAPDGGKIAAGNQKMSRGKKEEEMKKGSTSSGGWFSRPTKEEGRNTDWLANVPQATEEEIDRREAEVDEQDLTPASV